MFKKFLFTLLFVLTISAQDGQNVGWITKFGLAGGFNPIWISPNIDEVNNMLPGFGLTKFNSSGMIGYGGSGYIYILLLDNVRIGGMGFSATQRVDGTVNGLNREAKYNVAAGGFTIEYTLPFIKTPAVSVGAMIGAGSLTLDLFQSDGTANWSDIWDSYDTPSNTKMNRMENSFFMIAPTFNIDYPVTRYLAFRIGAGYLIAVGDEWELNNEVELTNVPEEFNANAFFVQAGIYLGFFAF